MITQINIKRLFNQFDYAISLPDDKRLIFISGPNGYGKTTILDIIDNLSKRNFKYFFSFPFDEIGITFFDPKSGIKTRFDIVKRAREISPDQDVPQTIPSELEVKMLRGDMCIEEVKVDEGELESFDNPAFRRLINSLVNGSQEEKGEVGIIYPYMEQSRNIEAFFTQYPCLMIHDQRIKMNPSNIRLSNSSRLAELKDDDRWTVNQINKEFKVLFEDTISEYSTHCQKIDNSFISRLQNSDIKPYSEEEYYAKVAELKKLNENLIKYGLITTDNWEDEYQSGFANILTLNINDRREKLQPLLKLMSKLDIFLKILERKELTNKTISITKQRLLSIHCNDGNELPLEKLSSGEQNLIILFFYLVFKMPDNGILLIDEPEKSLHLAWKRQLREDFLDAIQAKNCQLIVATHSVSLIDEEWEDDIDLFCIDQKAQ